MPTSDDRSTGSARWTIKHALAALTRRQTLRAAAISAAAVAGGATLAACGTNGAAAGASGAGAGGPLPVPASGVTHLYFQPNYQFIQWNKTTQTIFQEFVDKNFNPNPKYKGIWASCYPGGQGGAQQQIVASLAGSGYADVLHTCCSDIPTLEQQQMVLPLEGLLRKDNIPVSLWSSGHIAADSYGGSLYGLPSYDGTIAYFYRQDLLDQLGLPYPDPSWTWTDAQQLWTQCTGTNKTGRKRAGASVWLDSGSIEPWLKGWGADEMSADHATATMDSPEAVAALNAVVPMLKAGTMYIGGQDQTILPQEKAVFAMYHSAMLIAMGTQVLGTKYKWNILPVPNYPKGRATFCTNDCYLLNRATKHQNEAWELMKWINLGTQQGDGSYDNAWAKFQITINLVTPALVSLWEFWLTTIQQVAPPLQNKELKWFADAAQKGYDYPPMYFKYQPLQSDGIVASWLTKIIGGQISPELGLQQMQSQVNALQSVGGREVQAQAGAAARFPTDGPAVAALPTGI